MATETERGTAARRVRAFDVKSQDAYLPEIAEASAAYDAGMQLTDDPAFARLEADYAAYLEAWGAWMVAHHRGAPPEEERDAAAALIGARQAVGRRLAEGGWDHLGAGDAAALANVVASLPDLDAWATPLDGISPPETSAAGPDGTIREALAEPEPAKVAALRRTTFDAWGAAMANLEVDGERLDRLTVTARLATEADPARRRRLFLALEPGWQAVAGDGISPGPYATLLKESAARWARHGSPIDANAAALGMDPAEIEPTMRRILATFRAVALGPGLVEPWDYRHAVGGLARRLDDEIPVDRLRQINDLHLAAIGADPARLGIQYDIHPRPGRPVIPTAFTVSIDIARMTGAGEGNAWRPATPRIFATYAQGGLGNLEELLHESGHALHYAALRSRPAHFAWPPDQTAFVEAIADVVGWTTHEPAFLAEHLGARVSARESVVARHGAVMFDVCWTLFELEVHRNPDRDPNEVWAEIVERDLGIAGHPETTDPRAPRRLVHRRSGLVCLRFRGPPTVRGGADAARHPARLPRRAAHGRRPPRGHRTGGVTAQVR
ncbi:MAG: hypothetical protein HW391_1159 [Chloroflexi bacterium]|nr:hypothetical protein [Chloroflexota bacterium]